MMFHVEHQRSSSATASHAEGANGSGPSSAAVRVGVLILTLRLVSLAHQLARSAAGFGASVAPRTRRAAEPGSSAVAAFHR